MHFASHITQSHKQRRGDPLGHHMGNLKPHVAVQHQKVMHPHIRTTTSEGHPINLGNQIAHDASQNNKTFYQKNLSK